MQLIDYSLLYKKRDWSLLVSIFLICLGPIISPILTYIAFFINIFRLIKYDTSSFAIDIVSLIVFANIYKFAPQTPSVIIYLIILGCLVLFIREKTFTPLLIFLLAFLFFRSGFKMDAYITIASTLVLFSIFAKKLNYQVVPRLLFYYCVAIVISIIFGIAFQSSHVYEPYTMEDIQVSMSVAEIRFKGLFVDPNYLGTYLLTSIAILIQLFLLGFINLRVFGVFVAILCYAGIITYSKSFFLTMGCLIALWGFMIWKKKNTSIAIFATVLIIGLFFFVASGKLLDISINLERFDKASDLDELTTGRYSLWYTYINAILSDPISCMFGNGFDAGLLIQGSHNIYLETIYYTGVIGIILIMWFIVSSFRKAISMIRKTDFNTKIIASLTILVFCILYFSLQGLFSFATYFQVFIAFSALFLPFINKEKQTNI